MPEREDDPDDTSSTLKLIADNIRRIEELLRFVPLPDGTVKDLQHKIALLRTILLEQRPPALALVGRRGAGKSSLVNALFSERVAEVGHVKAQTGQGRWYDHSSERGVISVLDTRGIQEGSKPTEEDDARDAIASILLELKRKAPDVIVFLVKASDVDSAIDADLTALERVVREVEREHRFKPPLVAIATHCDLLEPKETKLHRSADESRADLDEKLVRVAEVERHLETKIRANGTLGPQLVWTRGISSYMSFRADGTVRADERWRVIELVTTLFQHLPDAGRGTFVRIARVRGLQEELASSLTRAAAALAAGIAAIPIPVADLIPITTLQVSLIASIAWLAGRPLSKKAAAEFLGAMGVNVGIAFAFREGARALIKFVFPGAGSMVSGAMAFGGTLAIGAAAREYFLRNVTIEEAKRAYEDEKARSQTDPDAPRDAGDADTR